jgi:hypothetical protein
MAPIIVQQNAVTDALVTLDPSIVGRGLRVSKRAYQRIGFFNMFTPDGYNPKTDKGRARGYSTAVLYLSPGKGSGYEVCGGLNDGTRSHGRSDGCTDGCLNTAGRGGFDPEVGAARHARTLLYFLNRFIFCEIMVREAATHIRIARLHEMIPAIRPNGTSDFPWQTLRLNDGRTLLETFPDVQFYDYTKNAPRAIANARGEHPSNYFLCFSRSEVNWSDCEKVLAAGGNVAVVFAICKCNRPCKHEIPEGLTYRGYRIVNGDHDDLRFLDDRGVIVGLKAKGRAKFDTSGFVVPLDTAPVAIHSTFQKAA